MQARWDIFCHVIDNFGDIGVCWRLARVLAHNYQQTIRLWVDDLSAFKAICSPVDPTKATQQIENITVQHWPQGPIEALPADIVISAFGCTLPDNYLQAMVKMSRSPVWINLEYLSAEGWIAGCHELASPHPTLPLTQYFYFPGFTAKTGGILYDPQQISQRSSFQQDLSQQEKFWETLGLGVRQPQEKRFSLFCYNNPCINELFQILQHSDTLSTCIVLPGPSEKYVTEFLQLSHLTPYTLYQQGNLRIYPLPFLSSEQYDRLLWACDLNFVRGEDSFIRAQLANRPFIWHIYPQREEAHWVKLEAFLQLYAPNTLAIQNLWYAWNGNPTISFAQGWKAYLTDLPALQAHTQHWTDFLLSEENLAAKLILFCENKLE